MHKDAQRRYASVDALIRDLDNYADGPAARGPADTWRYRTGKFIARHAAAIAAAMALRWGSPADFTRCA